MRIEIPENITVTGMTVTLFDEDAREAGAAGWKVDVKIGAWPEGHPFKRWPEVVDYLVRCEKMAWNDLSDFDRHTLEKSWDWATWEPDDEDIDPKARMVTLVDQEFETRKSAAFVISYRRNRAKKA